MSNQTEWQKWCAETAPVMAAAGRGEVVQVSCTDGTWEDKRQGSAFGHPAKYRIKPRTIRIGEDDVPEPMRNPPAFGSVCFVVNTAGSKPLEMVWSNAESDYYLLTWGMIHARKADAARHMLAIRNMSAVSHTVDSYLDGLQHDK